MKYVVNETQYKGIVKNLMEDRLRSYVFDWDDNILMMPTKIQMKKGGEVIDVSTADFAKFREDPNYEWGGWSFDDFRKTESFLRDTKLAIRSGSFAPSFEKFKESLIYANHFAINTARGHKPQALRDGVLVFIDMVLDRQEYNTMVGNIKERLPETIDYTDEQTVEYYLDHMGEYYPVSSDEFGERFGLDVTGSAANPEFAKQVAIEHFTKTLLKSAGELVNSPHSKVSVGFSDDDIKNIDKVTTFIEDELRHLYPEVHFVVYDTSDGGKKKLVIQKD